MSRSVLVIEDDPDIAECLRYSLEMNRIVTRVAPTGEEGVCAALDRDNPPALIVLDLLLPGMNGTEICQRLRREPLTRATPIIMLSAKASLADIASGLDAGANDYITKPFSIREVIARIDALLRCVDTTTPEIYDDGKLRLDFSEMSVICEGVHLRLTSLELALLTELAAHPGIVFAPQKLIDRLWRCGHYTDEQTLAAGIHRLRSVLNRCGDVIEIVAGVGYRFVSAEARYAEPARENDSNL
jgi:DNA-binding response OmpR family regulator